MPQFQRKSEAVIAQQWWPPGHAGHRLIVGVGPGQRGAFFLRQANYGICCAVNPGDWVVYEANGQMYAFSAADFEKLYSSVGGDSDLEFGSYGPQRQRFDQRLAAWMGTGNLRPNERMEGIERFYEMVNEDIDLGNERRKAESQEA